MRPGVLSNGNFRLLWAGSTISGLGSWLLVVAAPVQAYRLTGSSLAVSLTLVIEAMPALLVGPWAGVLADRFSHRATMVAADALSAAGVSLILFGTTAARIWLIYAGLLAENLAVAFFRPAARAILPATVGTGADLAAANSLSAFAGGAARLLAPPLGAVLLSAAGFVPVVALDMVSYLASAALTAAMSVSRTGAAAAQRSGRRSFGPRQAAAQLRDGLRYLSRTPLLRGMLITSWSYWTVNAVGTVLLVPFVVRKLGGQGQDVGYLIAGLGVGYLIGSAASRPVIGRFPARATLVVSYAAVGVCFLALFNAPTLPAAVMAAALTGIPGAMAMVVTQFSIQAATPQPVLGRVSAAFYASDAAAAIAGALLAPALIAAAGLLATLDLLGGAVIATAAAAHLLLPSGPARQQALAGQVAEHRRASG